LKQQKFHKIWKKQYENRNLHKTSKCQIKQSQKHHLQVIKKTQLHKKTSPNSWENRKVGNTDDWIFFVVKAQECGERGSTIDFLPNIKVNPLSQHTC